MHVFILPDDRLSLSTEDTKLKSFFEIVRKIVSYDDRYRYKQCEHVDNVTRAEVLAAAEVADSRLVSSDRGEAIATQANALRVYLLKEPSAGIVAGVLGMSSGRIKRLPCLRTISTF